MCDYIAQLKEQRFIDGNMRVKVIVHFSASNSKTFVCSFLFWKLQGFPVL